MWTFLFGNTFSGCILLFRIWPLLTFLNFCVTICRGDFNRPRRINSSPREVSANRDIIFCQILSVVCLSLLAGIDPSHAATPSLQISSAEFRQNALQIKGRLRNPAGPNVEVFDLDGHSLGLAPIKAKKYSFKLDRAKMTTVPCGVIVEAGGIQVMKPVKRAPEPCQGLTIKKAQWLKKKKRLNVAGHGKAVGTTTLDLYDLDGNLLASEKPVKPGKFAFNLDQAQLKTGIPCSIKVTNGTATSAALVSKAPAGCTVLPIKTRCAITEPANNSQLPFNQPIVFKANAQAKDSKAKPIKYEWDFAGGVMGHPAGTLNDSGDNQTQASFIRNNSSYRVRFAATDAKGERCEAAIEVSVGTPPTGLPPKVPEQPAPKVAGELDGTAGDLVVLPFEHLTMQSSIDALLKPNMYLTIEPFLNMNAQVYRKGRLPERLGSEQIALSYSAAANPVDPVGANSINSTSQNWPLGATLKDAKLQKSDMFEVFVPENPSPGSGNPSYMSNLGTGLLDEGFLLSQPQLQVDRGNYMPGIASPFLKNDPQPFEFYNPDQTVFSARSLPFTDIDDAGRINPYPLLRVEAKLPGNSAPQAVTDAVLSAGRDLHCRECHEKGGIAADSKVQMQVKFYEMYSHGADHHALPHTDQPSFFEPASDRLDDRERAAYMNIASIHDFYDGLGTLSHALGGVSHGHVGDPEGYGNRNCDSCHARQQGLAAGVDTDRPTMVDRKNFGGELREGGREGFLGYDLSSAVHQMHGQLMYNTDKSGILRLPSGRFQRWHPEDGPNPSPLFPVKDSKGNNLPMEENCLKCHGGQREQCYRDRMFTAGVTCYQCHGDMLAVGGFYKRTMPSPDGHEHRIPWMDEPECGSCHVGNANQGEAGKAGFFSEGIMNTAFDETDPAATLRKPQNNPDGLRFAVPITTLKLPYVPYYVSEIFQTGQKVELKEATAYSALETPLFRLGKDSHGNVSCAACHGAAHAIWPNRDPNANDNVTARQLQGHTGTILECSVCHSADAFLKKEDLDGGVYMGVSAGVLGGPHNLHPINDPIWWKEATGQTNGKGGWHNDYAQLSGTAGEDQCAACHGNDHKGTRLSKTPVAREFTDENGKKVKVKAGTMIGCDLCHSIEKSCTHSPNSQCGTANGQVSPVNRPPVFTSTPVTEVIKGEQYNYKATVSDPDGDQVKLSLTVNPTPADSTNTEYSGVLSLDADTGDLTANWAKKENIPSNGWYYTLTANDGRGGVVNQSVAVKLSCPSGLLVDQSMCVKIRITSGQQFGGLDNGQTVTYQVLAEHGDGLPLSYVLAEGAAPGISVNANGLVTFSPTGFTEQNSINGDVIVTDGNGNEARHGVGVTVCVGSQHWDQINGCVGPITFTSTPPGNENGYGMNVGETLIYDATVTHQQNLPVSFSLQGAPATMTIDAATGHLQWTPDAGSDDTTINISILASDGQGGLSTQPLNLVVCEPPQHWSDVIDWCE